MTFGPGVPAGEASQRFIMERYRDFLPVTDETPLVTLGEGGTPLVRSRVLEAELGLGELWFKLESTNPTGSFKDRGMVVAVAKAAEEGARAVLCASTGNTSASAAAYAARHGLRAYVLVPAGHVAMGKLAQAVAHGAEVVAVDGSFDLCLSIARDLAARESVALVNSVNPYRIAGQKTAAFEVVDDLGDTPDLLSIPVGNAGNITAYWMGFVASRTEGDGTVGGLVVPGVSIRRRSGGGDRSGTLGHLDVSVVLSVVWLLLIGIPDCTLSGVVGDENKCGRQNHAEIEISDATVQVVTENL